MPKLVAVSRVLNEEDVIEAMLRHHAALVDHHVILDNGSVDRTLEILAALKAEGISLSVLQNGAVLFSEEQFNTELYAYAVRECAADWVLFLDADEFVDARRVDDLRGLLASVPPQFASLGVQMINYDGVTEASRHEINVAQKFVRRVAAPIGVWKVFVRAGAGITINAGNHSINVDGAFVDPPRQDAFLLAHFPNRGALHWAGKAVTGWLKVLAAGEMADNPGRSGHYQGTFDHLLRDPQGWVNWSSQWGDPQGLVLDPIAYLGRPLLHTAAVDYGWRSLRLLLANTEKLATAYGRLLDENPPLRARMQDDMRSHRTLIAADTRPGKAGYGHVVGSAWRHAGDPGFSALLGGGWDQPEAWGGIWGIGGVHEMRFFPATMTKSDVDVEMFTQVPLIGTRTEQWVDVFAGDEKLATWGFSKEHNGAVRTLHLPSCEEIVLTFKPHHRTVPAELNPLSNDKRNLGLGIVKMRCLAG